MMCGNPEEVTQQTACYEEMGCDQVVIGMPFDLSQDDAMNCIRLYGERIIPQFDKDPVHRSTRCREGTLNEGALK